MAVPGRMINDDPAIQSAVINGEQKFGQAGCTGCHIPSLPLTNNGWIFSEPNPYNPVGNLQTGATVPSLNVDLTSMDGLTRPRLKVEKGTVKGKRPFLAVWRG